MTAGQSVTEFEFGELVGLSDDAAVVVAPGERAYVFEPDEWEQTGVLTPDGSADFPGHVGSVTVSEEEVLVGAPGAGAAGTVYVFERSGTAWPEDARFSPADEEAASDDLFGSAIDDDGQRVIVGATPEPGIHVRRGAAYVFERVDGDWTQRARLETGARDAFGVDVAISGDTALVGVPFAETDDEERSGAAYVYERSDDTWTRDAELTGSTERDGWFGSTVALSGESAVVGAPEAGGAGYVDAFRHVDGEWERRSRLENPENEAALFGESLSLDEGTILVAAQRTGTSGRVYAAERTNDQWNLDRTLVAEDANPDAEFGRAVALANGTALVGAPHRGSSSAAYLFEL